MSGPKRNPDKLNSIGIVVVGICGAVLVYVSIVALQAFYMNDSSEIQTMADYGGQDTTHKSIRTQQLENIRTYAPKAAPTVAGAPQTYTISVDDAIRLVIESAKKDPSNLVPANGPAVTPTVQPIFGRPKLIVQPAPAGAGGAAPAGAGDAGGGSAAAAPADGAGAGAGSSAPMTPTGGQGPGGGAPPGAGGQPVKDAGGGAMTPKTDPTPVQPKGGATPPPVQPKAGTPPATPAAQPKAGTTPATPAAPAAQPKATAPKGGATPPAPKKGNAA
jgi:hypothetical protein